MSMVNTEEGEYKYSPQITIRYQKSGNGPNNIVLIHGFACSRLNWHSILAKFPGHKYTLFIPDLKGYGDSSAPHDGAYSLYDQAHIIKAFTAYLNLKKFSLVGHSMGGGVVLTLATMRELTSKIDALVLLDSAAFKDPKPRFIKILNTPFLRYIFLFLLIPLNSIIRYAIGRIFYDKQKVTDVLIKRYRPYFYRQRHHNVYIKTAEQLIPENYYEEIEKFKQIQIPALIIWGKQDPVIPLRNGLKLADHLQNSTLRIIDECGHIPHEEKPEITSDYLVSFLNDIYQVK